MVSLENKNGHTQRYALILLWTIILVGGCLRFLNYSEFSFTNDELSALSRMQFDSVAEVIDRGVRPDGHPAGTQVFMYYWTSVFGETESSTRWPFVILGTLCIFVAYLLGRSWFNSTAGLLLAASVAFLSFPMSFSQLARPYTPGLFFSLLLAYSWGRLLFNTRFQQANAIVFGLSLAACVYTHYFAGLLAIIIALPGLALVRRENLKPYLLACAGAALLFLPHLGITLGDLANGGIGGNTGWLDPPSADFLLDHIRFILNHSAYVGLSLIALLFPIRLALKNARQVQLRWVALALFLLPISIGYAYSVYVNPVLQDRVLIFSFPFALLFLFSFVRARERYAHWIVLVYSIVLVWSTIVEGDFYTKQQDLGSFRQVASDIAEQHKKLTSESNAGSRNASTGHVSTGHVSTGHAISGNASSGSGGTAIYVAADVFHPYYLEHYLGRDFPFSLLHEKMPAQLRDEVDQARTTYFIYAWCKGGHSRERLEIIRHRFPYRIFAREYKDAGVHVYARVRTETAFRPVIKVFGFERAAPLWDLDWNRITHARYLEGKFSFVYNKGDQFGAGLLARMDEVSKPGHVLHISAWVSMPIVADALLAASLHRGSRPIAVYQSDIRAMIRPEQTWEKVFLSVPMPEAFVATDSIRIYVWNKGGETLYLDQIETWSEAMPLQ